MKYLTIGVLPILMVVLSGCGAKPTPFESPVYVSPLAVSTEEVATPTPLPSPPPDKGIITGRFVDYLSGEPAAEMVVYLGELSPLEGDPGSHIIVMLPSSSPSTTTDKNGYFVFYDVEPDTYAMVIWTPGNSWVVADPETGLDILVTVEPGAITDLGELAIDLPD